MNMSQTLIIYAHPYEGSFNHAILEEVKAGLEASGRPYEVIDLYADGFDPRYTAEELSLFSKGETTDPLVERYQKMIEASDSWIFVAPMWWSDVPPFLHGGQGQAHPRSLRLGDHDLDGPDLLLPRIGQERRAAGLPRSGGQAARRPQAPLDALRARQRGRRRAPHAIPREGAQDGGAFRQPVTDRARRSSGSKRHLLSQAIPSPSRSSLGRYPGCPR